MDVKLPLVKEVEKMLVDEDTQDRQTGKIETEVSERGVVIRDDGVVLINLIGQVDWNKPEMKSIRKNCTRLAKKIRRWNFDHSRRKSEDGHITVEWGQVLDLHNLLFKDYPKDAPLGGVNTMITLDEFEDWFDEKKKEMDEIEKAEQRKKDEAKNKEE